MKSIFIFVFIIFCSILTYSQTYRCNVFHSNGSLYSLNVKSINELGLIDSLNNYIAYKNIDSLTTFSEPFLEKVRIIKNVKYYLNADNKYVILFDKTLYMRKEESTFIDLHSMIALNTISYNFISVQFQFRFSFLPSFYHRVFMSGGNTFTNPNYHSMNFGYGIGIRMLVKEFDMQFWLNCASSTLYKTSDEDLYSFEDKTQFFFCVMNYINLNDTGNLQLGVGLNVYINQFEIKNNKTPLSLQVGLNFSI